VYLDAHFLHQRHYYSFDGSQNINVEVLTFVPID
jgi:hypothetical protein